jgi:3-mercaptopyruvate sulfurtransferase SseA
MIATLVVAAATGALAGPQSPAPAPPPQPPAQEMPAMPEDRRVKGEQIDSVMAEPDRVLLDVRSAKEIEELGGYEGAIHIPLPELEKRLGELPKDKTILTA